MDIRYELREAVANAVTPLLNQHLGSDLSPLRWSTAGAGDGRSWDGLATAGDYDEAEVRRVVQQWAAQFGFETVETAGMLEFRGRVGDIFITVWGVVDRNLFESKEA